MYSLTTKETKQVNRALDILRMALPEKYSKWPADLRKQNDKYGFNVIAWNGTCGGSIATGARAYSLICMLKNTVTSNIYACIRDIEYLDDNDRQEYNVEDLVGKAKFGPWMQISGFKDTFRTEDILLLTAMARKARVKKVTLVGINDTQSPWLQYRMFTFSIATGLYFHVLSEKGTLSADMEDVIPKYRFEDKPRNFLMRLHGVVYAAQRALDNALEIGQTVTVPYDAEDEDGNNIPVVINGNNNDFTITLKSIAKDKRGKIFLTGVDDNGHEYERIEEYDVEFTQWPYLTDTILGKLDVSANTNN